MNSRNKNLSLLLALSIVCAGQASASGFNPFLGKSAVRVERQLKKPSGEPSKNLLSSQLPPPPLPGTPSTLPGPPAPMAEASQTIDKWQVVGMINGQVTLMGNSGQMSIVENGSGKDGCVIDYPNIICNTEDIAALRQKQKVVSVSLKQIGKADPGELPGAKKEERSLDRKNQPVIAERASVKNISTDPDRDVAVDAVLPKQKDKIGEEITSPQKKKQQFSMINPLSDFEGENKDLPFRILSNVYSTANNLFGRNVLLGEKKGKFVYCATDRRAVSIRGL